MRMFNASAADMYIFSLPIVYDPNKSRVDAFFLAMHLGKIEEVAGPSISSRAMLTAAAMASFCDGMVEYLSLQYVVSR